MDLNLYFTNEEFEPIDEGLANRIEESHFTKPVLVMIWKQILLHFLCQRGPMARFSRPFLYLIWQSYLRHLANIFVVLVL